MGPWKAQEGLYSTLPPRPRTTSHICIINSLKPDVHFCANWVWQFVFQVAGQHHLTNHLWVKKLLFVFYVLIHRPVCTWFPLGWKESSAHLSASALLLCQQTLPAAAARIPATQPCSDMQDGSHTSGSSVSWQACIFFFACLFIEFIKLFTKNNLCVQDKIIWTGHQQRSM